MNASAYRRTVRDHFRILVTEDFGSVAVPANRKVGGEKLGQLLRSYFIQTNRPALGAEQAGLVIKQAELSKRQAARDALFALVPIGHNLSDQTILWGQLDLKQTLLSAVFTLWPSRAAFQSKIGIAYRRGESRVRRIYFNARRSSGFGTGDDSLASIFQVGGSHSRDD